MTSHASTLPDSARPSGGFMDRWLREQVLKRLGALTRGRLRIRDAGGDVVLGTAEPGNGDLDALIKVNSPRFYRRIALGGSIGAADSHADGDWDSPDLTEVFRLFVRNVDLLDDMEGGLSSLANRLQLFAHRRQANSRSGSRKNILAHYDLGNQFFELFLDPTLTYSSAVFETPLATLEEASTAKLDRICRKLGLAPHHHVLEIGTGWGSFAMHAAANFGCRVTTTTISDEQFALASERVQAAGLGDRITILKTDYRDLEGRFDRLASIEMIEAVGHEFLPTFFGKCGELLADDGLMVLQGITMPDQRYAQYLKSSDFIRSHVFPGSCCPALSAMLDAATRSSDLKAVGLEEIGPHYARTLATWRDRFDEQVEAVRALGFDESFIRMWRYYLSYCEAGFEERYVGTVQLALAKPGFRGQVGAVRPLEPLA